LKPLLCPRDAAVLLAIGSRKLWELTNCSEIPHLRIGRSIRYDPDDLDEWIRLRKRRGLSDAAQCKRSALPSTSSESEGDHHGRDVGHGVG